MKLTFILFCLIIFIIIFGIYYSPVFKVKSNNFSGEEPTCTTREEIGKVAGILGENILFLDKLKLGKNIKDKFLCIRSATVYTSIPDRVKIDLKNRRASLTLLPAMPDDSTECEKPVQTGQGLLVDDEGIVFALDVAQSSQPAVFILREDLSVGKELDQELIQKTVQVLEKVKSLDVNADDPKIYSKIYFSLGQKPQMVFILDDKSDRQLASLQLILDQAKMNTKEVEFLDLRFDKPIVRYGKDKN